MSGYRGRSRSPVRRSNSDKYSRNDRGYDRRDNRRYDDHRSRRDRDDRRYEREDSDRNRKIEKKPAAEDMQVDEKPEEPQKKRVPISIEELVQKREQEKRETERVSSDSLFYAYKD
jgi:ATP-dependent RNA helicase DDX23/PRP28